MYPDTRDHRRRAHFCLSACMIAALFVACPAAARPPSVELVAVDPWTFDVVVSSAVPFLGGEIGIGYSSRYLKFLAAEAGDALLEAGESAGNPPRIDFASSTVTGCAADPEVDTGLIVYWIAPENTTVAGLLSLPRGTHNVLHLRFEREL